MIKFEGRVRKVEEKVRDRVRALDVSADVSALEKACRDGDVALAAKLLAEHLEKQWAKYGDDPDSITQIVLRDNLLRELSGETLHQIRDYCREGSTTQPNL